MKHFCLILSLWHFSALDNRDNREVTESGEQGHNMHKWLKINVGCTVNGSISVQWAMDMTNQHFCFPFCGVMRKRTHIGDNSLVFHVHLLARYTGTSGSSGSCTVTELGLVVDLLSKRPGNTHKTAELEHSRHFLHLWTVSATSWCKWHGQRADSDRPCWTLNHQDKIKVIHGSMGLTETDTVGKLFFRLSLWIFMLLSVKVLLC